MAIVVGEQAFNILKKYGIQVAPYKIIKTKEQLTILKLPCVLKSIDVLHKTEKKAIQIVHCKEELIKAYKSLKGKVIYQPFLKGKEVIIGAKQDSTFGPVLMFGLGGIYTEVFKDISFRACPITNKDAGDMISEIKAYPILKGVRNQKSINFKLLKSVLIKTSQLAIKEKIKELDINPFIVNDKQGFAVDIRIVK